MVASGYSVERAFGVSFACWVLLLVFSQIYLLRARGSKLGVKEIYLGKKRIHYLCALTLICILVGLLDPGTVFMLIPRLVHLTLEVLAVSFLLAALLVVMFTYVQAYYRLLEVQGGSAISKYHLIVGWILLTVFYWGGEFLAYVQGQRRLAALSKCLILILLILLLIMELYDYCEIRNLIRELMNVKLARRSSVTVTAPLDRTLSGSNVDGTPRETPPTETREVKQEQEQEELLRCPIAVSKRINKFQLKCLIFTTASLVVTIVMLALDIMHAKDPLPVANPDHYEPSYVFLLCLFACLCFLYRVWTPFIEPVLKKSQKGVPQRGAPQQDEGEKVQFRDFFDIELSMKNQVQAICNNDNSINEVAFYVDPDPLDSYVKKIAKIRTKNPEIENKGRTLESDIHGFFSEKKQKNRGGFERAKTTLSSLSEEEFEQLSHVKTEQPQPCLSSSVAGLTIVTEDLFSKPIIIITDQEE